MALGRLPPAHLAACGCTQIGQIWIGSAALVPKQDRRQNGGYSRAGGDQGWLQTVTRHLARRRADRCSYVLSRASFGFGEEIGDRFGEVLGAGAG